MTRKQLENTPGINDILTFGKYRGKTILQVIDEKPSYVAWCIQNVKDFKIDGCLKKELMRQYNVHMNWLKNDGPQIDALMKRGMHASEAIIYIENCEHPENF